MIRGSASVVLLCSVLAARSGAQQPPPIGIAAVSISEGPYLFDTAEQHRLRVVVVAHGLVHPFGVAVLPNGDALVTERGTRLRVVRGVTGQHGPPRLEPEPVAGLPAMATFRGAGIQDVVLHPSFASNGLVYVSYNKAGPAPDAAATRQSVLAILRARFDGRALSGAVEIFAGDPRAGNSGSRLAFGADGLLYVTTGAPDGDFAQRLDTDYGKVLRLQDDGRVPEDNPFASRAGARPEIFSTGHRDQLGLAVLANGTVLASDHGPNGGDELNVILPGRNYGWPTSSYGRNYDGARISETPLATGIEQPLVVWLPSIAPSGLTVYTGDRFPAWKGNLFVGSARRGEVPRTGGLERVVVNGRLEEIRRETLLTDLHQRIRDVRQGPDGLLYVITDEDDGVLLRLEPGT
jgi:glucose/arabinose dehydrogenase